MNKTNSRAKGFTLAELIVSGGLFIVLMGIAVGGFIQSMRSQRLIESLVAVNDNMSLVLEQIAREVRTGSSFCTGLYPILALPECSSLAQNEIEFVNSNNDIVRYRVNNVGGNGFLEKGFDMAGGIVCDSGTVENNFCYNRITSDNIDVKSFNIKLMGNNEYDNYPPRITLSFSFSSNAPDVRRLNISLNIQTTISARLIDT